MRAEKTVESYLAQPEPFKPDWASYRQGLEDGIEKTETKQAPVAWQFRTFHGEDTVCSGWDVWEDCTELKFNNVSEYVTKGFYQVRKLYTSPQTREPLSDAAIRTIVNQLLTEVDLGTGIEFCGIIEKAHGIGE